MANGTYQKYFGAAQLALAAYSDFSGISPTADGARVSLDVRRQLRGISKLQAQQFAAAELLISLPINLYPNGFSASVFRDKQSGQSASAAPVIR